MAKIRRLTEDDKRRVWSLYFDERRSSEDIAEFLGFSGPAIRATIRRMGGAIRSAEDAHRSKALNEHAFDVLTPEVSYWLGLLITDGSVYDEKNPQSSPRVELELHQEDVEHLKAFDAFMGGGGRVRRSKRTMYRWDARSKHLAQTLLQYGVRPRKTKTATPAACLVRSSDFWRGCWDGDGEVDEGNNCPAVTLTGSFPLVQAFCDYFLEKCPEYPLKPRPTEHTNCTAYVNLYGHGAMVLLKTLYGGATTALPRKLIPAKEMLTKYEHKTFRVLKYDIHQRDTFPFVYTDLLKATNDFQNLKKLDARTLFTSLVKSDVSGVAASSISRSRVGVYASHRFHEATRMRARVSSGQSPMEMWEDPVQRNHIIAEAESRKHSNLRASMSANCRPCWGFLPAIAKAIYQRFGSDASSLRILDPCAGWGDRLTAALSLSNFGAYVGCDPNTAMAPVYERIKNCYAGHADARVYSIPFEDAEIPENSFHVAFTSPPYFDYEHYSDDPGQSSARYPDAGVWRERFLAPLVEKCARSLIGGGTLAINISDAGRAPLVEWLIQEADKISDLRFIGTILMPTGNFDRANEGIYCWRKIGAETLSVLSNAKVMKDIRDGQTGKPDQLTPWREVIDGDH